MANTTIRALTTLSGANIADADLFILHDFSANTEVSVTPVALASALNQRIGAVGSANGISIVASSTNTALSITQTGTGNAFLVEDSASVDSTPFVIKGDGLVGIGTTAPTNALHVVTSGVASGITLENTDAGATVAPRLTLYRNSISPANSDIMGSIFFTGNSTTANNVLYARINTVIDDVTTGSENGRITIDTVRDGVAVNAMTIGSNGRIRIGPATAEPTNCILGIDRNLNYNAAGTIGVLLSSTIQSDVTTGNVTGFISNLTTQAATFTVPTLNHFTAQQAATTFGAGSTVTAQSGFSASSNMIDAITNVGFNSLNATAVATGKTHYGFLSQSNIATGGGTAWNFYASGTAPNYFAGVTQFADGAAATPSITNIGDTNTGVFFPAADTFGITTNGVERLRVDSTGNFGIGGIITPRAQFHVLGVGQTTSALTDAGNRGGMLRLSDNSSLAGAGGTVLFGSSQGDTANSLGFAAIKGLLVNGASNTTGDLAFSTRNVETDTALAERMRITSSGVLLVNKAVSTAVGSATVGQLQVNTGNLAASFTADRADTVGAVISLGKLRSGGAVLAGDVLGHIRFAGHDGVDTQTYTAQIGAIVDGTPGTDTMPSAITLSTGPAATVIERMRIDSAGNVGIGGTANTAAILDVQSTTKGFLPPRMTITQRNAIASPPAGLTVYNTTTGREEGYDGTSWIPKIPLDETEDRIINGGFDVWQRGTTSTASGYVAADRWFNGLLGGTVTQSRQAFTLGDLLGMNSPTYFLRQSVTGQTLATHYASTTQRFEGVRTYAGQTITVLGWAKRATAGNIALSIEQYFGTGGTPSADVNSSGQTLALTTSWAPFAITFAVPSITGKTLGTNNNDFLQLSMWSSAGSDFNSRTNTLGLQTTDVDFWGIHIREGTWATADTLMYRQKDIVQELDKCYRYYYRVNADGATNGRFGMAYVSTTSVAIAMTNFPVRMRIAPTALEQSGTAGNYAVYTLATGTVATSVPTFLNATTMNAMTNIGTGATLVAGQAGNLGSAVGAGYLGWSAEL